MMEGESGKRRDDTVYRYYKCSGVKRKLGCDKKTVRKTWIEDLVIAEIKKIVYDDALIEQLADDVMKLQESENTVVPVLKNQLAEVEKGIENLLNAIMMGICGESTKNKMAELEARKSELQIQIAKEELGKPKVSREIVVFWFHKFRTFDTNILEHRRKFIDAFVNAIFLYDDKLVITFNYKNGTKTVTFAELEATGIISDITSMGEPKILRN